MRPIQWIFDTAPTEEAKLRAIVHVNQILYIMKLTKSIVMQQIWTDGRYFFHFKASPATNSIRVWGVSPGDIRFWVYADRLLWGITFNGSEWGKVPLTDLSLLPATGNYHWSNGTDFLYSVQSTVAPARHFTHDFDVHTGHYARFGTRTYWNDKYWNGSSFVNIAGRTCYLPAVTNTFTDVARESQKVEYYDIGTDAVDWVPFTGVTFDLLPEHPENPGWPFTFGSAVGVTRGAYYADQNTVASFWNGFGMTFIDFRGDPDFEEYLAVHDDGVDIRCLKEVAMDGISNDFLFLSYFTTRSFEFPISYANSSTNDNYPITRNFSYPPAWSFAGNYYASSDPVAISAAFDRVVVTSFNMELFSGFPVRRRAGRNLLITLDHDLETAVATDIGPMLTIDIDHVVTPITNGNSATHEEFTELSGFGFDVNDDLAEVKIEITKVEAVSELRTSTIIDYFPPPDEDAKRVEEVHEAVTWSYTYTVKIYLAGSLVLTHTTDEFRKDWVLDQVLTKNAPTDPTPAITGTISNPVMVGIIEPQITIHDVDLASKSISLSILEMYKTDPNGDGVFWNDNVYPPHIDVDNSKFIETLTYTDYVVIKGSQVAAQADSSVLDPGTYLMSIGGHYAEIDPPGGSYSTSETDHELSSGSFFPESIVPIKFYGAGTQFRFMKDHEGNVITFCPTGQEAYDKTNGSGAVTPAIEWRINRPSVFKLFNKDGVEKSLASLGFTEVEAIGACDKLEV